MVVSRFSPGFEGFWCFQCFPFVFGELFAQIVKSCRQSQQNAPGAGAFGCKRTSRQHFPRFAKGAKVPVLFHAVITQRHDESARFREFLGVQDVANVGPTSKGRIHQNAIKRPAQVVSGAGEEVTDKEAGRLVLVEQIRGQWLRHFNGNDVKSAASVGQGVQEAPCACGGFEDAHGADATSRGDECRHARRQRWRRGEELVNLDNLGGGGFVGQAGERWGGVGMNGRHCRAVSDSEGGDFGGSGAPPLEKGERELGGYLARHIGWSPVSYLMHLWSGEVGKIRSA
jgi:hypothetical protein